MLIEITLWISLFTVSGNTTIGGFDKAHYLSYVLWAAFVGRITSNWTYEFRMSDEIESGSINGLLVRPFSFFEYYLSQFYSYKLWITSISLLLPFACIFIFALPTELNRIFLALLLIAYYLILVHAISFCISCANFYFNKVSSLTVAKNIFIGMISGEIVPLDLFPEPYRSWALKLPFANAVYTPIGYITGRVGIDQVITGFYANTFGILFFGAIGILMWHSGMKKYVGTGA